MNIAYNMDCLEYMKTLPDNYFDLCIADPPYGDALGNNTRFDFRNGQGRFDKYGARERERETASRITVSEDGLTDTKSLSRTGGTWAAKYGKKS